jgi:hypothetical protein
MDTYPATTTIDLGPAGAFVIRPVCLHVTPSGKRTKWTLAGDFYDRDPETPEATDPTLAGVLLPVAKEFTYPTRAAAEQAAFTDEVLAFYRFEAEAYAIRLAETLAAEDAEVARVAETAAPTMEAIEAAAQAAAAEREAAKATPPAPRKETDPALADALELAWREAAGDRDAENRALALAHDAGMSWVAIGETTGIGRVNARRRWVYATGQPIPASWAKPSGRKRGPSKDEVVRVYEATLLAIAANHMGGLEEARAIAQGGLDAVLAMREGAGVPA